MNTCPETTDGQHIWDEYEIPGCVHDADGDIRVTEGRQVRECYACGARS